MLDRWFPSTPDSAARLWITSAVVWMIIALSVGFLMATQFMFPDLTKGVGWLTHGRIRPVHVNGAALGWLSTVMVGLIFYFAPRLLNARLWSERLGNFTGWFWNVNLAAGLFFILGGHQEGREWAELIAPFDWGVLIALSLVAVNVFLTIANRREGPLYVSIWYFAGSLIWIAIVWIIGNRTFLALDGLNDAITNWFYAHNVIGLWITTVIVGISYYLLPRLTGNVLYSHLLSMVGFWTIAMFYPGVGVHHILQLPVPEWLKTFAVISSVLLFIPVSAVLINFFMTMAGKWGAWSHNLPLRFLIVGNLLYLLTAMQGSFQAIRSVNWYLHFTQWVVGHAHLALFGFASFIAWAGVYYALPRLLGVEFYSKRLVNYHFWLSLIGFAIFFSSLTVAGLVQAVGWAMGATVQSIVPFLEPYMAVRWIGAAMMITAQYLFAYNVFRTIQAARAARAALTPAGVSPAPAGD